jgi:hypothetical protein
MGVSTEHSKNKGVCIFAIGLSAMTLIGQLFERLLEVLMKRMMVVCSEVA